MNFQDVEAHMSQFKEDWHEYVLLSCAIHGQVNYLAVHDECNCICAITCFFIFVHTCILLILWNMYT
jgi:hypothetical protein